jgi:CheY-like chemotaxis protein/uncharacterized membrane protein YeaQ/YmgE (transglycosylase-associated protein family)
MMVLSWLFIGLIAGWLTSLFGGGSGFGVAGDIVIGISGAILGGFIVSVLVSSPHLVEGLNADNFFGALAGGVLAVMLVGVLPKASKAEGISEPVFRPQPVQKYFEINGRVLVIESDKRMGQMLTLILNELGFEVTRVHTGRIAFEKLQQDLFDFIILDMFLMKADNFEICSSLRVNPATKDIPIMLIASGRDQKNIEQASQLGIVHFLSKPFTEDELLRKILTLLKDRSRKDAS